MRLGFYILTVMTIAIAGCQPSNKKQSITPDKIFREFVDFVKNGQPFSDQARALHSKNGNQQFDKFAARMEAESKGSFKPFYAQLAKSEQYLAKCSELILISEAIDKKKASLVYDRKETCKGDQYIKGGKKVQLVYEDGWKIETIRSIVPENTLPVTPKPN